MSKLPNLSHQPTHFSAKKKYVSHEAPGWKWLVTECDYGNSWLIQALKAPNQSKHYL
jgi:hypothetical protein